jgi:cytochrome c biogenesis protein CcmG/thiol:disulfide interchange protein DsbE
LVGIAILVGILASGFGKDPHAMPSMLEGRPAPAFALVDLDGNPVTSATLKGTPYILNFWSTWCGPCKEEHPYLQDAARAFPGVKFYGVLYSDDPVKARRFLANQGTAYPTLVDSTDRIAVDYGVTGVPETFFVDKSGTILHKQVGPVPPDVLQAEIEQLGHP